jgi:hypothetical protein
MNRFWVLSCVACLALAGVVSAEVNQGDTEIELLAGWMAQNGDSDGADFDSVFLSGAVGYFLNDNVQVQGVAMGAWTSTDFGGGAEVDVDVYGIGGRAKYHFMPTNQWVPYVGGQILWSNVDIDVPGTSTMDGDVDGVLWGPVLGLRYELNAYNDFYVEYQYHIWSGDAGDFLDDGHGIFVGIVHQFK